MVDPNPPGGSTDDEDSGPSYVGVPKGYRPSKYHYDPTTMGEDAAPVEYTLTGTAENYKGQSVDPKYKVGDEGRPASWPDERIVELQAQMVDAGLLKVNAYQRGVWDLASENAYTKLLTTANQAGLDADQTLSHYRRVAEKYGRPDDSTKRERAPFIFQRRDPEALRALLGSVSGKIMGAALSPEEEDRFISSFNEMSESAQRAAYVADGSGLPGGPGGVDQDIDLNAQASKFLRESRPQDVVRHDVIERFDQFQSLLNKYS